MLFRPAIVYKPVGLPIFISFSWMKFTFMVSKALGELFRCYDADKIQRQDTNSKELYDFLIVSILSELLWVQEYSYRIDIRFYIFLIDQENPHISNLSLIIENGLSKTKIKAVLTSSRTFWRRFCPRVWILRSYDNDIISFLSQI